MNEKHSKQPNESKAEALHRWLIRAICCLGVAALAGLAIGGVLLFRIGQMSGWSSPWERDGQVEIYSQEQIDKFITSVLITVQNQPLGQANAQADMVFIASFNAFEQRLSVVALAGQTLAEVEGYGQKSLAEAFALGGPGLLVNTMNKNFGLDLQNYASTDTHSLAAMIDLLGGIQAQLTHSEADYINAALGEGDLRAGRATLTGTQSMVHAMDGLSGHTPLGNLERSLALVHSAIFNMRKTATKEAMLPLLSLVFSNIQTNLDLTALNDLGYEILKAEEIEYASLILPAEGSWEAAGPNGEYLQADVPANAELLRETLYDAR